MPYTQNGLLNAVPTAFKSATTQNYVSTLSIHKPEVTEEFVQRYGDQSLTGLLDAMGAMVPAANKKVQHWEEDFIHQFAKTDAATAYPGTGATATISIDPAWDINNVTIFRVNDIIEFPSGDVAIVTAVTDAAAGAELTVYPLTDWISPDSGNLVESGDAVIITGNAHNENTGQPTSIVSKPLAYENDMQILKESYIVSGSEMTNIIYFEVQNPETGESGYLWYIKGEADTYKRFVNYCEMQMLTGKRATNSTLNAVTGFDGFQTSEGLLDFIENGGNVQNYNQLTGFNLSDFDAMVRTLSKNRGARENSLFCGTDLSLAIDDAVASMFAGGGVSYGAFSGMEELAVAFGFKSFMRGGYTFHKKTYDPFSYAGMLGADGFKYSGLGFLVPGDMGVDAQTRDKIPALRMRYKEAGGYSREMEHWFEGSAGLATPTSGDDQLKCNYRTERCFEGFGANRFMLIKKA
tara:strand:- start:1269 stop:2660 length:1392 start_codon:yes stop_codon:yes gene_type:complete